MSMSFIRFSAAIFSVIMFTASSARADLTTFTTTTAIAANDFTYDGDSIIVSGVEVSIAGPHSFAYIRITNGGWITHPQGDTAGLQLTVATDVLIDLNASIWVRGKGYLQNQGPGAGVSAQDGGGAGYGGLGGYTSNPINGHLHGGPSYGTAFTPVLLGSGGGGGSHNTGGSGGGRVDLNITGTFILNGYVDATGNDGTAPSFSGGGGSGGSVFIRCNTFTGTGYIHSNGGIGAQWVGFGGGSGGGGGGRVAVYYSQTTFTGTIQARGREGWNASDWRYRGGAGSIATGNILSPDVRYDNGNILGRPSPWHETFTGSNSFWSSGKADVEPFEPIYATTVILSDSGYISAPQLSVVEIYAADIILSAQSQIFALGRGHPQDQGPGAGVDGPDGGGGGYGGNGGDGATTGNPALGGTGYGNFAYPTDFGSGGGGGNDNVGGAGGGVIFIDASGTITNNGLITASGANGLAPNWTGGGGSGGSIIIECSVLEGTGAVRADGGVGGAWSDAGGGSGGGGGGRIALFFESNNFDGEITACGKQGWSATSARRGGAGTIYYENTNSNVTQLIVGNCSAQGVVTLFDQQAIGLTDVFMDERAVLNLQSTITADNFYLTGNSSITADVLDTVRVSASGYFLIDFGSSVDATGKGHAMNQGPGAGGSASDAGGAGHGGVGGNGCTGAGGFTYGVECSPNEFGSGGGAGASNGGGRGGGIIRFSADTLVLNGTITANGANGFAPSWSGGGGSGGSILLSANYITGLGTLSANGGSGGGWGPCGSGGGGGGRVALWAPQNLFPPANITVDGGARGATPAQDGADGTICLLFTTDCNENNLPDQEEISEDPGLDVCPQNGVLDECEFFGAPQVVMSTASNSAILQWPCVPQATSYDVYSKLPGGTYQFIANTTNNSYDVSSLFAGGFYDVRQFYVVAVEE